MLERVMYNRVYNYVAEKDLLNKKQFGFQSGLSTNYVVVQLDDQVLPTITPRWDFSQISLNLLIQSIIQYLFKKT